MFCQNCGKKLADDATFCPACGKKRAKMPDMGNLQDVDAEQGKKEPSREADAKQGRKEPSMGALRWKKTGDEDETLDETDIKKKKRNLCIGVVLIAIALVIFVNTGGGTYSLVKSISFDDIGKEAIGEIADENIKSP